MSDFSEALLLTFLFFGLSLNLRRFVTPDNDAWNDMVKLFCLLFTTVGILFVHIFIIALFFKSSLTWYAPFLISIIALVASVIFDFLMSIIFRSMLLDAVLKILSIAGLIVVTIRSVYFFFK